MKHKNQTRVCVIGLGYIGLPTAALLANRGYQVLGVDIVPEVVEIINKGQIHIVEPELDTFVKSAVNSGFLKADTKPDSSDIFILAVPTPFKADKAPDLSYVEEATHSIAPFLKDGDLVILESTSPVGTTEMIGDILKNDGVDTSKMFLAHCPERVLPGNIMKELIENDRVIGGVNDASSEKAKEFYSTFVSGEILITNSRTAEMAKLTENSYRDVNIAFTNEISILCDQFGINPWELIKLANHHPRVNILQPGCGVGGHCIAVDPWFIIHEGKENARLLLNARTVNLKKTKWVEEKITNSALQFKAKTGKEAKIACMGLAFKANIDDLRESPAMEITKNIISKGFNVLAVEPNIRAHKELTLTDYKEAFEQADIVAFLVGHKEFKSLPPRENKDVLDFCGITEN